MFQKVKAALMTSITLGQFVPSATSPWVTRTQLTNFQSSQKGQVNCGRATCLQKRVQRPHRLVLGLIFSTRYQKVYGLH